MATSIAESIRGLIADGTFIEGRPLPSERALSERFGVSRLLIREAVATLSAEGLIHSEPNCRPTVRAIENGARRTDARHIAVWLWPQAEDYMSSSTFRGVQRGVAGTDFKLIIAATPYGPWQCVVEAEEQFLMDVADDPTIAGAVIWYVGGDANLPALQKVQASGVPMVFLDRKPPQSIKADYVGTDNLRSAYRGVSHLVELGHRRIVCVTNSDQASAVQERVEGYSRALTNAGIQFDDQLIVEIAPPEARLWPTYAERTMERIMAIRPAPTAIFVINDVMALYFAEAARTLGLNIPEDISLLGFDGLLHWTPGGGPLTTMVQDFTRIGEIAVELIFERFQQRDSSTYRHVLIDAPLSLHGSTGALKSHDHGTEAELILE